jgi:hypothetical protein
MENVFSNQLVSKNQFLRCKALANSLPRNGPHVTVSTGWKNRWAPKPAWTSWREGTYIPCSSLQRMSHRDIVISWQEHKIVSPLKIYKIVLLYNLNIKSKMLRIHNYFALEELKLHTLCMRRHSLDALFPIQVYLDSRFSC